jgi:hypothetical protein
MIYVPPPAFDMIVETILPEAHFCNVTYKGGYTADTVPATLRGFIIDIAQAIQNHATPNVSELPPGAISMSVGDVSITYGGTANEYLDDLIPGIGTRLKGWVKRT